MKYPADFVDRVRNTVDIVDLIGSYVQLRKRGQNHTALCPFHQEKTPSFAVSESKQIFKCFGCGAGGDIFSFIQQIENLTFPDAIGHVAERYGIPLPQLDQKSGHADRGRARLLEVMDEADRFFRLRLSRESSALTYLKKRSISRRTADRFGLGYAPPGNLLTAHLQESDFQLNEIEQCGLVNRDDRGNHYDKFRSRIIFPIHNLSGRTIAFGGRIIGDGRPKYLNSPETPLYSKSHNLYGLYEGRDSIRQKGFALLVEGYFDCLVPAQHGVENVVASLGTALTEDQVKLLGRYTRNVIVSYDPDSAGVSATTRSIDLFLGQGFQVNILRLPQGEDPDSFIQLNGVEAYSERIKLSAPYIDFLLDYFSSLTKDPRSPRAKQEIATQIIPYLLKIPNRIERAEYVARTAAKLQIEDGVLLQEIRRFSHRPAGRTAEAPSAPEVQPTVAECTLLAAVLEDQTREQVLERIGPDLFRELRLQAIFERILELRNQNQEISVLKIRGLLEEEDKDLFDRLSLRSSNLLLNTESVENSVDAIQVLQLERLSREIQAEIAREEKLGGPSTQLAVLLRRKESIQKQRQLRFGESKPR